MKKLALVVIILLVAGGLYVWSTYNRLVGASESVTNQWAQVESQYQRRFDLIPNLVNAVKGTMTQEQEVFGALADARTRYTGATTPDQRAEAASQVEGVLGRLLVIMENYPQLRSVEAVTSLMSQLEGTENRISVERKRYNDQVTTFNIMVKRVPTSLIAGMFGYQARAYFEAERAAATAPTVDLDLK